MGPCQYTGALPTLQSLPPTPLTTHLGATRGGFAALQGRGVLTVLLLLDPEAPTELLQLGSDQQCYELTTRARDVLPRPPPPPLPAELITTRTMMRANSPTTKRFALVSMFSALDNFPKAPELSRPNQRLHRCQRS